MTRSVLTCLGELEVFNLGTGAWLADYLEALVGLSTWRNTWASSQTLPAAAPKNPKYGTLKAQQALDSRIWHILEHLSWLPYAEPES